MSAQASSVAVVGGGLGGLAAACVAAARGHKVTLYDKNSWIGGKAAVLHEAGFRFDMGPTILTVPRVLERIFAEAGRNLSDYLDLVRLDPQWRCFFDDGTQIDLQENIGAMAEAMDRFAPGKGTGDGYRRFQEISAHLHDISNRFFFWKPVEDLFDTINIRANMNPATLRDVLSLRMGSSVAGTIRSKVKDERLAQMLDHFTQYVGSSPYGSPAVLCAIAHMQAADGVWYPMGGTRAVAEALAKLATELGATIRTDSDVASLRIENGAVAGPRPRQMAMRSLTTASSRTWIPSAPIASSSAARSASITRARISSPPVPAWCSISASSERYDHLLHHDFVFSRDPEEEFDYHLSQAASPRRIRPAISRRPPRRIRASRRRAARRSTFSCTRRICARITTGRRCSRPIGR